MSYFFVKTKDPANAFDHTEITHEVDTCSLDDLIREFEHFLRGSGFYFNGTLEIVVDDNEQANS